MENEERSCYYGCCKQYNNEVCSVAVKMRRMEVYGSLMTPETFLTVERSHLFLL